MTRIQTLASRPKRTLGALAVVLAAVGITVGSGANFSASKANAGTFAAGKLSIGNQADKTVFTASDMYPGGPDATGYVNVKNTGTVGGKFSLAQVITTPGNPEDGVLRGKLKLKIVDCGDPALLVYDSLGDTYNCPSPVEVTNPADRSLTAFTNSPLKNLLGSTAPAKWGAGEEHNYQFTVSFPDAGGLDGSDNGAQGGRITSTFTWKAIS